MAAVRSTRLVSEMSVLQDSRCLIRYGEMNGVLLLCVEPGQHHGLIIVTYSSSLRAEIDAATIGIGLGIGDKKGLGRMKVEQLSRRP